MKINKAKLVAQIKKAMNEKLEAREKEMLEYPGKVLAYKKVVLGVLEGAVAKVRGATTAEQIKKAVDRYGSPWNDIQSAPTKPTALNLGEYMEALKRLDLCTDEIVDVRDKDNYLRLI